MKCLKVNVLSPEELVKVLKVEVSPTEAQIGEYVEVKVTVRNDSPIDVEKKICADMYSVSGALPRQKCFLDKTVTIPAGRTVTVSLGKITFGIPDTYVVDVEGVTAQFTLKPAPVEVEYEKIYVDPTKKQYFVGESVYINYKVYFNQEVDVYAWIAVNGEKIAEKRQVTSAMILDTTFTILAKGTYEICGDYKIMS